MAAPQTKMRRQQDIGLVLEIDGYAGRWYMGASPPPVASPYVARKGLVDYHPTTQSLKPFSAIVDGGGCHIEVAVDAAYAHELLTLRGDRVATLAVALAREAGAVDVVVEESVAGWPSSGVLWIGREAMAYDSHDGTHTFSVTERGYYNSKIQRHRVDASGRPPQVYDACGRWRGRRARVRLYRVSGSTWTGGHVEVAGYIVGSPREQNRRIEIEISPLAEVLRQEIGGDRLTTTFSDLHAFDGITETHVARDEVWPAGAAYRAFVATAAGGTDTTIPTLGTLGWRSHIEVFDISDADRKGPILIGNEDAVDITAYNGAADTGTIDISDARPFNDGNPVTNAEAGLTHRVDVITPGTPEALSMLDVLRRINTAWSPGTNQGASGAWADAVITTSDPEAGGRPSVRFRVNSDHHPGQLKYQLSASRGDMVLPVDFASPDDTRVLVPNPAIPDWTYPGPLVGALASRKTAGGQDVVPLRTITRAWWAWSKWWWVEDDVFSPPDAGRPIWIRASYTDLDGTEREEACKIIDIYPADDVFPGKAGYLLETDPQDAWIRRAVVWPLGAPAPVIRQAADWQRAKPTTVIKEILMSGLGDGFNDPVSDRLPFGLDLDSSELDEDSIDRLALPPGPGDRVTLSIQDAVVAGEIIEPMLQLARAALVDRLDPQTGARKLAAIPVGPARTRNSMLTITRGMWIQSPRPASQVNDDIINVLEISTDYNTLDDKYLKRTIVHDEPSVDEHGVHVQKIKLRGVALVADTPGDRRDELLPWALEVFEIHGTTVRQVRGKISFADGVALYCGGYVVLEDAPVRGDDGLEGISGPATILELTRSPVEGTIDIVLSFDSRDSAISGWAPALKVESIVSTTAIIVEANAYTATTHPVTGEAQTDLQYFAVSDAVRTIPLDFAAGTATTITAINAGTRRVDFAAPHGFTTTGRVRSREFAAASTGLAGYAFLADADGALSGPTEGRRYG